MKSYCWRLAVKKTVNSVTYLEYSLAAIWWTIDKLAVRSTWTEYLCSTSIDWARYDASEQERHQQDASHLHRCAGQGMHDDHGDQHEEYNERCDAQLRSDMQRMALN